ncbi:Cof subfamily protein (haloacid dehalogenase superfamily) [Virgibacillus natechei]|uniref:Cof subfamily protein (Haloacid dehalogenase superfamily) n=1 Tax=Virgibacillus natechei TaxID=1216297 RepID=A0ABS4IDK4_9BACI|nr:Cof-type HAD-IIB family hydrolase [Virgibacillus natechei]MBP1969022.1 Cof subfamily protein (haloacid dehalogenase superfamily) [Virgibacillus natechei]UZD14298.1 Cof-type HAD-IIB family hydrolase [Virgibacillus natechei]
MKKHLIALDLDGTLLTDNKEISSYTKQIVLKAAEEGHIIVIATGRPHRASINYYHNLGLNTPMVNFNGALLHHPTDQKWDALHNPMPMRTAHKIIDACFDLNVHNMLAEVMDDVYLDQYDEKIIQIFQETQNDPPFTIGNIKHNLQEDPTSLLIHPKEDHIHQLRRHLNDYHAELIEHRKWGAPWNIIEIVKKGMNKAVGLQKVAYYYDIPAERIIAFGDEDNDLEMIEYAGVGVAMGNAIDELQSIAKHVTDTNEQDGIGIFLKEYLKL